MKICMKNAYPRHQRGAAAIMFAIMLPVLMGFITLGIEGARYLAYQGQLRNAAEVASLVISARGIDTSDKNLALPAGTLSNEELARAVVDEMVPDADDFKVTVEPCKPDENCNGLHGNSGFYQYRVKIESNLTQWFPDWTGEGMGFYDPDKPDKPMTMSAAATSRKHPGSGVDVVFVADFSGSMNCGWDDTDEKCQDKEDDQSKIKHLRTVIKDIAKKLEEYSEAQPVKNTMALVPFNFHTRNSVQEGRDDDDDDERCQIRQVLIKDKNIVNEKGEKVGADYWIETKKMFTEKGCNNYNENNDSNFYTVSPATSSKGLISKINGMNAKGGTASYEGIIRAAQLLNVKEGTNPYRLIIVLSDGEDYGYRKTVHTEMLQGWEQGKSYCDTIRTQLDSLTTKSGRPVQSRIAVIGIDYKVDNDPNLENCAGKDNVFKAENMKNVYDLLLKLISEEVGHLYFDGKF